MTTVASIMTREIFAVRPETDLETTAKLLTERHITGAPVIDAQCSPIGVVTLTDLVDPLRERSDRLGESKFYCLTQHSRSILWGDGAVTPIGVVADVMSRFVLSVEPQTSLWRAAERMVSEDVHRLLVVDHGRLVGIVTSMDVLRGFVGRAEH